MYSDPFCYYQPIWHRKNNQKPGERTRHRSNAFLLGFPQGVLLYNINSVVIAVSLFLLILLANEVSYRIARRSSAKADQGLATQTNAIQAGVLGLLALLLGFSFNMALQRFDARSTAVS